MPEAAQAGSSNQGEEGSGAAADQKLAHGLKFSMPAQQGMDAATLKAQGVGEVVAGVDDLMAQLSALGSR